MTKHPTRQSPTTPPMRDEFDQKDLILRPSKRQLSFFQRRRNPFNVAIPFHFPPTSPEEMRQRRLNRLRATIQEESELDEAENDLQQIIIVEEPAIVQLVVPSVEQIISEIEERREKRRNDLQKHVARLKQAQNIKQRGGFLNMPDNVKIRPQNPKNLRQNKQELDRMIQLAAVAGAVKKQQAACPRQSIFVSSPEERERARNQIALRQIQKLKKEVGENHGIPSRQKFMIPLAQNMDLDDEENEENEYIEREITIAIETICQAYQRMKERGLRSDFIFNNLKQSLENVFNNIFLIRTRYRGGKIQEPLH